MGAGAIDVTGLGKAYPGRRGPVVALADIDLRVAAGEIVGLLGPSGCGKSTLLNIVAGFVKTSSGQVAVDGEPVLAPGPDRGVVFNDLALFPWMSVEANVGFGLDARGIAGPRREEAVTRLLDTLGLREVRALSPDALSGAMAQRVALARALAPDPGVLLMDEPFARVDALTRRNLQEELLRIWEKRRRTILFVTHSIDEALLLADRIVVMTFRPGRIKRDVAVPLARPRDVYSPVFNALKRTLSALVMEEQRRSIAAERGLRERS